WDGRNYLVVWSDRRSGETFDIYGTRISPEGRVMDKEGIVISGAPADQYYPSVAWNGKVHLVTWMDMRGREESAAIYGARITPEGRVLEPEGLPIATSPEFHAVPFVIAKGEEFLVLWEREKKVTHKDVYAVRLDSSGQILDPEPIGIITEFEHQSQVSVSTDGQRYFIVWMDYRNGIPFEGEIYARFLDFSTAQPHSSALMSSEGDGRLGPFLIHQISIHPKNPGIIYAATSHYGILKSEDKGQEWVLFNQGLKSYTHRAIVVHPTKPEILYTGSWGGGMSKSSDGGRSWQEINTNLGDTAVTAIVLHPKNPEDVYVVSESGVFRSRNGGMQWESISQGLNRSSDEAFQTLLILPVKPHAMYLGSSEGIYQWDEESEKWVVVRKIAGENITTLNYSKGSKTLYAGTLASGFLQSVDEGKNWERVPGVDTFWIREIVFDPANPDIIYLAMKGQGILKSTDQGKSWQLQNNGLPDIAIQSLAMAPDDHKTLYAGTYEDGIFVSRNAGESWEGARSIPWLTSVEVMNSLPVDEDMRSPEDIEMIVHSPSVAEHAYLSEDKEMMPPPAFVKCNRCHGWTDPFLNLRRTYWRVPANTRDWGFTVKHRMGQRSGLTQKEEEEIIEFLERYSRRGPQQESLKSGHPALEFPREAVQRICSQCHGLEVNGHCLAGDCSKGEGVHRTGGRQWTFVVDWMRSMGARMDDQEQRRITDYLTETYPAKPYPLAWEKAATLSGGGWNVTSLTTMGSHIYAGTEGGGRIYRSADGMDWEEVCNTGEYTVYGITEFKGAYFAGANSPVPEIWKSLDGKEWSKRAVLPEDQEGILSMGVFKDYLYAGTGRGKIYRSPDGERWEEVATLKEVEEPHWVRFIIEFKDELYVGTQPGLLYRSRDGKEWIEIGEPI
ncbi:MAG: hypothetical protein U0940_00690, partial [Nitrospirota bacterium]|nr:hypothetical protein [Nitrospirota bacterium]